MLEGEGLRELVRRIEDGRRQHGWDRPAVLHLAVPIGPGAAVLAAIRAELPTARGEFFLFASDDLARVLTDCCGPAGATVGRLLDTGTVATGWVVQLDEDGINYFGIADGAVVVSGNARYEAVGTEPRRPGRSDRHRRRRNRRGI